MRIAITGTSGFIGSHLRLRLHESRHAAVTIVPHNAGVDDLRRMLEGTDWVFHLAGVNRPTDPGEFQRGNVLFTQTLSAALEQLAQPPQVVFASSAQADVDNPYGRSKRDAEDLLRDYGQRRGAPVVIYRLPHVFGKWARPYYNSVVATFCHQVARDLPLTVHDPAAPLHLLFIDDLIDCWEALLLRPDGADGFRRVDPVWDTDVGSLAQTLRSFRQSRIDLMIPAVGIGLMRGLYATYLSHVSPDMFTYAVPHHDDARGRFVEFLKTPDCGQFSYFTARPGVTRGEHYHHTKSEKFLVIQGTAQFGFRHIVSGETHEVTVRGETARVVETVPGWAHNISNIGSDELIVLLWATENFDRQRPDTHRANVRQ